MPSFTVLELLITIAIITLLVALLIAAIQRVRLVAARTQSMNNLKQIVLAFHGFHDSNKRLPFNGVDPSLDALALDSPDPEGFVCSSMAKPNLPTSGNWAFQILPFVEQGPMFATANVRDTGVAVYMNYAQVNRARPRWNGLSGGVATDYW